MVYVKRKGSGAVSPFLAFLVSITIIILINPAMQQSHWQSPRSESSRIIHSSRRRHRRRSTYLIINNKLRNQKYKMLPFSS